jgi:signal transduction histidine kinase
VSWKERHRARHAEWHARHGHHHPGRHRWWQVHWRLRRRIFLWFALAVALSAFVGMGLYRHGLPPWIALLVMVILLWAASGVMAWRLTLPLVELERVTRELGAGNLEARAQSPRRGPRELIAIAGAVNDMAARIARQLLDQRELLAAVSHEIRTPLGHVRILLDTAREQGAPAGLVAELEREVLEVDALVDQLLASSRLDFGALERRELDVALESARTLERLGVDASVLDVESDRCVASADATLLRSALANLVRNAIEHGGGVTRLAVRRTADAVEVEVDDAGPVFRADDLPRVFEPFYRGQGGGDKPARGSLGLGLSLVDRIARAHGGSARAANRDGGGARVMLSLPLR